MQVINVHDSEKTRAPKKIHTQEKKHIVMKYPRHVEKQKTRQVAVEKKGNGPPTVVPACELLLACG